MFKKIKNNKHNWILIVLMLYIPILLIINYFTDWNIDDNNYNTKYSLELITLALFIAPIIEEFTFRLYFFKETIKKFKIISFMLILLTIVFLNPKIINFIFLITLILLTGISNNNNNIKKIVIILNSVLFSVIHIKNDVIVIGDISQIIIRFSYGLLLVYITINYNLWKSMFVHFLLNLIAISTVLFVSYYIAKNHSNYSIIENNDTSLKWRTKLNFKKEAFIIQSFNDSVQISNITIKQLKQLYDLDCNLYNSDFVHYDFVIYIKNNLNETSLINCENLQEISEIQGF